MLFLRDYGETEVGGFGIAAEDEPLLIEDFRLVRQSCTWVTVSLHDDAVADFCDQQIDAGRPIESFFRIWCHTHPGDSAMPSNVDEQTFSRVFGEANWAVMFIIARQGDTYARLRFGVGPGAELTIPVEVDFSQSFAGSDTEAWVQEYQANVHKAVEVAPVASAAKGKQPTLLQDPYAALEEEAFAEWQEAWWDYVDESAAAVEVP